MNNSNQHTSIMLWIQNRPQLFLILVGFIYFIVALNSSGYYHWDEHYQLVEFAYFKLGLTPVENLAWEYHAAIRPSLQPTICYLIFKLCYLMGITNPFTLAFILRLLTAIAAISAITLYVRPAKKNMDNHMILYYILTSYFIWFIAFINVRFSAESWSGFSLLAAVSFVKSGIYKKEKNGLLLMSAFLGISILFKYQSALLAGGLILWMLIIDKINLRKVITIIIVILITLFLGYLLDRWMYGQYVFTLYNYFHVNLVKDVASNYGTSPWYEFIIYILTEPGPVIGPFLLAIFIGFLINRPNDMIIWIILPYLIIHSLIPHKEVRFLFPMVNFIPYVVIVTIQDMFGKARYKLWIVNFVIAFFIIINSCGLFIIASKGAGTGLVSVAEYIDDHYRMDSVNLIYINVTNPYQDLESPKNSFYKHPDIRVSAGEGINRDYLSTIIVPGRTTLLLLNKKMAASEENRRLLKNMNFHPVFQTLPSGVQYIYRCIPSQYNNDNIELYEYKITIHTQR